MRPFPLVLLFALASACRSPMEASSPDAGQGGVLGSAGHGGIGQGGSSVLPVGGGVGGKLVAGTGGASGGVAGTAGPSATGGAGGFGGTVTLPGSGGAGGASGTGEGPTITASVTTISLGTMDVRTGAVGVVTLTNVGRGTTGSIVVVASTGLAAAGCNGSLPPGASCSLTVVAAPTAIGPFLGTLTISADPGAYPTPLQVAVVGTAVGEAFTVSPRAIDFGPVFIEQMATSQGITVTAAVPISDLLISSSGPDVFIDRTATTCTAALAAGVSCLVGVGFLAATPGTKQGNIMITAGGKNGTTIVVPITALAQAPARLVISPDVAGFAAVTGQPSPAVTFNVANLGDVPTGVISATVVGPDAPEFAVASGNCLVLAALATCTLAVEFKPAPGNSGTPRRATLNVSDTAAGGTTITATLTGRPYEAAALTILPSTADLGEVAVGTTGLATTFTLLNTGDVDTSTIRLVASTTELRFADDTCSGTTLAAHGGSCTFTLALHPSSTGAKAFTLRVVDGTGTLVEGACSGTGIVP